MSTVVDLDSGYRLGFRVALASARSKKEKQSGVRDSTLRRKAWKARCIGLGELSTVFPFLEPYSRFTFKRAACDARDVFPGPRDVDPRTNPEIIFRCNQSWVCPWCSTRPTIKLIRRVYLALKEHEASLDGMVWSASGWKWEVGPIDSVSPKDVDQLVADLIGVRVKSALAVLSNTGNTVALISRTRVLPGRPATKGSPPPLVVSHRLAFLGRPDALVIRRWSARPGTLGLAFSPQADNPGGSVTRYTDLCRYLAAYPASLAFCQPLVMAHLLRVKDGARPGRRLIGCALNL